MLDAASGPFRVQQLEGEEALRGELERLRPTELLINENLDLPAWLDPQRGLTRRPPWHFDAEVGERLLTEQFGTRDLSRRPSGRARTGGPPRPWRSRPPS